MLSSDISDVASHQKMLNVFKNL